MVKEFNSKNSSKKLKTLKNITLRRAKKYLKKPKKYK